MSDPTAGGGAPARTAGGAFLLELALATVVYAVVARLGLAVAGVTEQVSVVWPATGVALALLVLRGRRLAPAIALGAFAVNLASGASLGASVGIALGNTLEALIGATLLMRAGFDPGLRRLRDVAALFVFGAVVSTLVSATIGATSLCLFDEPWSEWPRLWAFWWIGDAIGNLVVAPFILTWADQARRGVRLGRLLESAALVGALLLLSAVVFATPAARPAYPVHYLIFPGVIWSALRLGQHATASLAFVAACVTTAATLMDRGPFVTDASHAGLLQVQLFMAVVAVTGLFLGAATAERNRAEHGRAAEYANLRRSEERLAEQAAQLAEVDRRKDEFLAVLGHELRNPLAPLQNALTLLARGAADPELVARAHALMERQLRHLVRLVDDLLDLSRIRTGKIVLTKEPVELADMVEEAAEIARPVLDARRHRFSIRLPPEAIELDADATRLPQLLANLLNNAAKYTAEGGEVTLDAAFADGELVLRVRDTGMGMRPEDIARVFELFAQGGDRARAVQGGLGVGLSLARSLAQLHGGSLTAASEGPGKGSEFTLRLPARRARASARSLGGDAELPDAYAPAGERLRVLVVDDHIDAAESLAMVLAGDGHHVLTAHDGRRALAIAHSFRPDAMVLDLGMPGLDGFDVARAVRADPALAGIRLIALSGFGAEEDRRRTAEAGFERHLVKPVDPERVVEALQKA